MHTSRTYINTNIYMHAYMYLSYGQRDLRGQNNWPCLIWGQLESDVLINHRLMDSWTESKLRVGARNEQK